MKMNNLPSLYDDTIAIKFDNLMKRDIIAISKATIAAENSPFTSSKRIGACSFEKYRKCVLWKEWA